MNSKNIPWIEKYRPNKFENIVLDSLNREIFENIIKYNNIPNLIFYGPPGTGKTTTIINLINKYQETYNQCNKGLMIHLNASDERGIDIIRNQIKTFVNSKSLFVDGIKFVILDEVDYMTKNAQKALKYLVQDYNKNVRYCLICNYISRLDHSLQNEFVRLRFSQLPEKDIYKFLNTIIKKEKLDLKPKQIKFIQNKFKSDIRSMINYIQSNHSTIEKNVNIITDEYFRELIQFKNKNKKKEIQAKLQEKLFNKTLVIDFIYFLLDKNMEFLDKKSINIFSILVHNSQITHNNMIQCVGGELERLYK